VASESDAESAADAPADPDSLTALREPVRVEIELESCGRWVCGLADMASRLGLEVTLGFGAASSGQGRRPDRGMETREFLSAGMRVRLLVSPSDLSGSAGQPFQLYAKVLWVAPPTAPSGSTISGHARAALAVDTADIAARTRWEGLVGRSR
jgi:hypothetical protein